MKGKCLKMKNKNMKEKVSKILSNKSLTSPTTSEYSNSSNVTHKNWEVPYIDSKQNLYTEHGIFHFELVLKGILIPRQSQVLVGQSVSRVKFCPVTVDYKGHLYDFFVNPVDKVSVCKDIPNVVIPWKEGNFSNPVINLEELTPEEQFSKHKVLLENYIEKVYVPEIFKLLSETEFR